MPENTEKSNPATGTKETDIDRPPSKNDDFNTRKDLDGKSDSGPEPDVHGREIPPQD